MFSFIDRTARFNAISEVTVKNEIKSENRAQIGVSYSTH